MHTRTHAVFESILESAASHLDLESCKIDKSGKISTGNNVEVKIKDGAFLMPSDASSAPSLACEHEWRVPSLSLCASVSISLHVYMHMRGIFRIQLSAVQTDVRMCLLQYNARTRTRTHAHTHAHTHTRTHARTHAHVRTHIQNLHVHAAGAGARKRLKQLPDDDDAENIDAARGQGGIAGDDVSGEGMDVEVC